MTVWYFNHDEMPTVRFEPCDQFRIPLQGDRLTCRECGHWAEDHEGDDVRR